MGVAQESVPSIVRPGWLEEMFWAHHKRILRAAYRVTGNMADAEDVAQAVFMRLVTSSEVKIASTESYLYRAAINGALDLLRSRQSGREVALDVVAEAASAETNSSPEGHVSNAELRLWLRQAISTLSPRSAEMFVLRYIEELDNQEIARLMGTSRAVVAVMLHQARARLKKQFERSMRGKR